MQNLVAESTLTICTALSKLAGAGLRGPPPPRHHHTKTFKNVDAVTVCFLALCCIVELYTLIYQKWPPIRAVIGIDYRYNGNVSQLITTATCVTALQLRCMCLHSASLKDAIPFRSVPATPYRVCYCAPDASLCCMLLAV